MNNKYASDTENIPNRLPALPQLGPCYYPVTEQWQKEKCQLLGISYEECLEQQPALTGSLLTKFIPLRTEKIGMDGNCFFRCISKIVSGTEKHYAKLRAEVCRFMVTDGRLIIKRYLRAISKDDSPVSYLKRSAMTEDHTWASDVEIVAVPCMLNSDIFIATQLHDAAKLWRKTIWNKYSGCINCPRHSTSISLYIYNVNYNHYESVVRLILNVF